MQNGVNVGDDANFHNLTNARQVIAVGAYDPTGQSAYFSNPGTNLLVSAPGVSVKTTNGLGAGASGYAYVSGTSFAAPLVSSAVALMLEVNPDLGYRDVQEILAITARPSAGAGAAANGASNFNGGGLVFDREMGFGKLDVAAAVGLASTWERQSTAANEQSFSFSFGPVLQQSGADLTLMHMLEPLEDAPFTMQWIEFSLEILDPNLKGLRAELISPSGTASVFFENLQAAGNKTSLNFTFTSAASWGENPYGTWQLNLSHEDASSGYFVIASDVRIYGDLDTVNDSYYFTESYASLVAQDPTRTIIRDTDGGIDTLNFGAARSAVYVDLAGNVPNSFKGVNFVLDGVFENVFGSSAADVIMGSSGNNRLTGGAGADTLLGRDGDDTLVGGKGNDFIDGGDGFDLVIFDWALDKCQIYFASPGEDLEAAFEICHAGETDIVVNVENLSFSGVTLRIEDILALATLRPDPQDVSTAPLAHDVTQAFAVEQGSTEYRLNPNVPENAAADTSFTIIKLPKKGSITLDGVGVVDGQVLDRDALLRLCYTSPLASVEGALKLAYQDDGGITHQVILTVAVTDAVNGTSTAVRAQIR
jgi:Ca2+-binding RTX toxin-like protein